MATSTWRLLLAGLTLLALGLRLPTLPLRQIVEGDGVHYASLARVALAGDLAGVSHPHWYTLWPTTIAATSLATGCDVVRAGRIASLLFGSLLAPLLAVLGARLFGRSSGFFAGLAVAVHPWLLHFSTLVYVEPFFAFLTVSTLLLGLQASRSDRVGPSAVAGLVAGLATVTRPEGQAAALAVFLFLFLPALRPRGWLAKGRASRKAGVFLGGVLLLLTVRMFLVHASYGLWDFGGSSKGVGALYFALHDYADIERAASELGPTGESGLAAFLRRWTLLDFVLSNPGRMLAHVGENVVRFLRCGCGVFPLGPSYLGGSWTPRDPRFDLVAVATLLFAAGGAARGLATRRSRAGSLLVLGAAGLHVGGLAIIQIHDRFLVTLVPAFLLFFGHGLAAVPDFARRALARSAQGEERPHGREAAGRAVAAALVLSLLVSGFFSLRAIQVASDLAYAEDAPVQKEAGEWLAAHFPQSARLMAPWPHIAFYFYDAEHRNNEIALPWNDYRTLLAFAHLWKADLIAAPEWRLRWNRHPAAEELLNPGVDHPGLDHLTTVGRVEPYRIHLYRIVATR
ncbi:MAG: glycosyltransferase family 39 protein [Planctomycetes bacterium]|nr:glycosyltransferase family 39 protein [Planctomycetota bacterium]